MRHVMEKNESSGHFYMMFHTNKQVKMPNSEVLLRR